MKTLSFILSLIMTFFGSLAGYKANRSEHPLEVKTVVSQKSPLNVKNGETNLHDTVEYAYEMKNTVQGVFADSQRNSFRLSNSNAVFTHGLRNKHTATLEDTEGNCYIADSFKTFYTEKNGLRHYFEDKLSVNGRVNVIRLGEYYYDCHIRDFSSDTFKVDKNYHVYGDRIYSQYSLYSEKDTSSFVSFGTEIAIPKSEVSDYTVDKENGFAAFAIKNVGVVGFIIPSNGSTEDFFVDEFAGKYIFTQTANCGDGKLIAYNSEEITESNPPYITFGSRIYTDKTDNFDGIRAAAYEERNPLEDIAVGDNNAECRYLGYDALRGAYTFTCKGTDFNIYYTDPGFQFNMPVTIKGDSVDRKINIRFFGQNGCLEAAAVLDDSNNLAPVDVEVCKNFCGDGGEGFYSVRDYQYGDSFIPFSVKKNSENRFTMLHLYNGWGKNQLKQLSSIEFHVSYYHLSTGTTESNCIAPYSVSNGDSDGWLLPDFRTRSGNVWTGQPQYNSVGILKFMVDSGKYAEYSGGRIDSCGQCFSDITNCYTDLSGRYTYSLRHVEFPSNDENRTFYRIELKFNEDTDFDNFRKNFSLFSFNGRFVAFNKLGYLNSDNKTVSTNAVTGGKDVYYTLGTEKPYYSFYDVTEKTDFQIDNCFGCNFSFIIRDSEIICGGTKSDVKYAVRLNGTEESTQGDLTLDTEKISFKKGDSISMNVILLPNGVGREKEDTHALSVRDEEDLTVRATTGKATGDSIVPSVAAQDNKAEFTVTGGKNLTAVRVDNITTCAKPTIYVNDGVEWKELDNSLHGYDGYSVTTSPDGTYSVSFVYDSDGTPITFRVEA